MIITHTSNPSIDYYLELHAELHEGVQRAEHGYCLPGGKGLNVSMVLNQLGIPSVATAFLGGLTGDFISQAMKEYPCIRLEAARIEEANRINVKIRARKEWDSNAPGPQISSQAQSVMLDKLKHLLHAQDWLLISGSLARQIGESFLIRAAQLCHEAGAFLVLDVPGISASLIARLKPQLIKPNVQELYGLFPESQGKEEDVLIRQLQRQGVANILLSDGANGARFYTPHQCYRIEHPRLRAISTVGSGDSMLAAFVGMLQQGKSIEESLVWAAAAGQATAISHGLADREKIERQKDNVSIVRTEAKENANENYDGKNRQPAAARDSDSAVSAKSELSAYHGDR